MHKALSFIFFYFLFFILLLLPTCKSISFFFSTFQFGYYFKKSLLKM